MDLHNERMLSKKRFNNPSSSFCPSDDNINRKESKSRLKSFFCSFPQSRFILLLLAAVVLFVSSCVYYNTFYNAKKYFESAQSQELRDTGRPTARAIQDYDKVIERCTYILKEHSDSRWADDALFLLARSTYYKRQSPLQAKERFQDLLRVFPDSEHVPITHLYIAKIDYEMQDRTESYRRLREILDNDDYRRLHPEVLLVKSNFYLEDGDFVRAQDNLQAIIERFPRSQQFEQAFFTLGEAHFESGNYNESKEVFRILVDSRASRRTKLNSRYYIALNLFYLNEYEQALELLQRLVRQEYEQNKFPRLHLLRARCLAGLGNYEEAESLFQSVIENNRRTAIAAEASYYLAEMYFLDVLDYEKAIASYNQIRTEFRNSRFVEKGVSRSAVVSQIVQFSRTDRKISITELIEEQFKLAEYYLYVMNMPDSSLSVYREIEKQEVRLAGRLDSLRTELAELSVDDTSGIDEEPYYEEIEGEHPEEMKEAEGSGSVAELQAEIESVEEDLQLFQTEFVPYSMFASAWVWLNIKQNRDQAEEISERMESLFPENRYTHAVKALLNEEEVIFATPFELQIESEYENAISILQDNPAEAIEALKTIDNRISDKVSDTQAVLSTRLHEIHTKTIFSLGYAYYFHLTDSLMAKPYFDEILTDNKASEYGEFINKFYRDNVFIVEETLFEEEEKAAEKDEAAGDTEDTEVTIPEGREETYFDEFFPDSFYHEEYHDKDD